MNDRDAEGLGGDALGRNLLLLVVQWFENCMIGSVSAMIVSRSRDKEAYLKEAYGNVRSMALQDLNPLRLCVIYWLKIPSRPLEEFLSCNVSINVFVETFLKGLPSRWALCQRRAGSHFCHIFVVQTAQQHGHTSWLKRPFHEYFEEIQQLISQCTYSIGQPWITVSPTSQGTGRKNKNTTDESQQKDADGCELADVLRAIFLKFECLRCPPLNTEWT